MALSLSFPLPISSILKTLLNTGSIAVGRIAVGGKQELEVERAVIDIDLQRRFEGAPNASTHNNSRRRRRRPPLPYHSLHHHRLYSFPGDVACVELDGS